MDHRWGNGAPSQKSPHVEAGEPLLPLFSTVRPSIDDCLSQLLLTYAALGVVVGGLLPLGNPIFGVGPLNICKPTLRWKFWFYTLHLGFCISMSTRKFIVLRRMWIHNRILKQRRSKLTSLISWGPLWRDTNPIYDVDNANLNNPNIFLWSHAANFVSYYLLNVILPYS